MKCETCLWWCPMSDQEVRFELHLLSDDSVPFVGWCRRYPPVPQQGTPRTHFDHWCGEHKELK